MITVNPVLAPVALSKTRTMNEMLFCVKLNSYLELATTPRRNAMQVVLDFVTMFLEYLVTELELVAHPVLDAIVQKVHLLLLENHAACTTYVFCNLVGIWALFRGRMVA